MFGFMADNPRVLAGKRAVIALAATAVALAVSAAGCASDATPANSADSSTVISAVGAENEYANVLAQIGGQYVHVSSILNNPNTDPHTFEASPAVAQEVSAAGLSCRTESGTTRGSASWSRPRRTPGAR